MRNTTFGLIAEYLTIIIYRLQFYNILHHRMRKFSGEIDIIAVRAKQIVFIEVKAREVLPQEKFVSHKQQARIRQTATLFLASNPKFQNYDVRFDLVVIIPYKLPIIYKNAW